MGKGRPEKKEESKITHFNPKGCKDGGDGQK